MGPTHEAAPEAQLPLSADDLSLLRRWFGWRDAPYALRRHFNAAAFAHLDRREAAVATLRTAEDWRRRQQVVRERLAAIFGPFPQRTPLNAHVTGTLRRDGYRVEKVVFESRPGFHVTGCLFIPEPLHAPAPAILNPIGHTDIAFRAESYQTLILNFVRKGFVVFAYDPPGQGERLQYFDPQTGASRVGRSTQEHSYFGRQLALGGESAAAYFAWDGIRAVDYLLSRPEVDARRVGATGISGGGTQATYVAALDERVLAAAPTCYITSFKRLLESIGPQDAEQNPPGFLTAELDHADLLEVRAPRPALVVATTRDFFSIQGARETCVEVARAYAALGAPRAFDIAEDDHGHGYTPRTREALYAFFQRALDFAGDPSDEPVDYLTPADLTVTSTGQVSTALKGKTVFSVGRARAASLVANLAARRRSQEDHLPAVRAAAARLSGYRAPGRPVEIVFAGRLRQPEYAVDKVMLSGGGPTTTPALVLVPADGSGPRPAALVLQPEGKAAALTADGIALTLVRRGWIVLAPDLSGRGELASQTAYFEPVLAGGSVPGVHAAEIVRAARYLLARDDVRGGSVAAVAAGDLGAALLHAAVLGEALASIALVDAPLAWASMALNREYAGAFDWVVPGALAAYDLPDLAACLAPAPLALVNPVDHLARPASDAAVAAEWHVVWEAYRRVAADPDARLALLTGEARPAERVAAVLAAGSGHEL